MSKYLVFLLYYWEAGGGWSDYIGTADTPQAAIQYVMSLRGNYKGYHLQLKRIEDFDNPRHHARYLQAEWDEEKGEFGPFEDREA